MLSSLRAIPVAARWLGFGGLLPFALAAVVGLLAPEPLRDLALRSLIGYGAVILSFLGGVRWGLAMATPERLWGPLSISVLPALLGWIALLLPTSTALLTLALGFAAMLMVDLRLAEAPPWYRLLRLPLSLGAVIALLLGQWI